MTRDEGQRRRAVAKLIELRERNDERRMKQEVEVRLLMLARARWRA